MTTVHIILSIAVISTGLLMTILAFFQKALKDLTAASEFTLVMHHFLKAVRTHPLHYALVITSMLAPIAVLLVLRESAGSPTFVLVLVGLMAFVAGPVLVSRFFVEPIYDVFLSWRVESPPEDWRKARGPLLPPQRDPGPRLGGCLRSFSDRPVPTLTGGRGGSHEREPIEERERGSRTLVR